MRITILEALKQNCQRDILHLAGGLGNLFLTAILFRVGYVQNSRLFPRMSMILHHDGSGTSAHPTRQQKGMHSLNAYLFVVIGCRGKSLPRPADLSLSFTHCPIDDPTPIPGTLILGTADTARLIHASQGQVGIPVGVRRTIIVDICHPCGR